MAANCRFTGPSTPNLSFLDARSYKCSMPVWQAAAAGKDIVLALCRDFTDPWFLKPDAIAPYFFPMFECGKSGKFN